MLNPASVSGSSTVGDEELAGTTGKVKYFEGTPIPTSTLLVLLIVILAVSGELDPEDMRDLVMAYQAVCADAIMGHSGFLARYLGDGVLAYFGYPGAHEDDARLAVAAGTAIVESIDSLRQQFQRADIDVRVGLHTGEVVVVGATVGDLQQDHEIVGETPNLAARLQAAATPGVVVVSDRTRELVEGFFALESMGELALKGFARPVQAWRVRGQTQARSRLDAELVRRGGIGSFTGILTYKGADAVRAAAKQSEAVGTLGQSNESRAVRRHPPACAIAARGAGVRGDAGGSRLCSRATRRLRAGRAPDKPFPRRGRARRRLRPGSPRPRRSRGAAAARSPPAAESPCGPSIPRNAKYCQSSGNALRASAGSTCAVTIAGVTA